MTQKLVCQINAESYFVGQVIADESPLEKGVFLIPAGSVDTTPPVLKKGQRAKWDVNNWVISDIPQPEPEPKPPEPTPEELAENVRMQKQSAYQRESDPLFFKWQAGEVTKEQWEAKRAEIYKNFAG